MKKRIAFFTVGFAFNRLVRMRFYEKIFPKSVRIYLITTDKYKGKEKESYQQTYELDRTEVITLKYNPLTLPFQLRKFCEKKKIDRLFNLGFHTSVFLLFFATFLKKGDYFINVLADTFNQHWLVPTFKEKIKEILILLYLFPFVWLAKKIFFTDKIDAKRASIVFLSPAKKMIYLAAPVDTALFKKADKIKARKKLNLKSDKKIVIFVGRINYLKCSDILKRLIENNSDIFFIVIGKLEDKVFINMKTNNYKWIEKINNNELVNFYNASDFSFCVNRGGGGIGLSTEEAMACGIPAIVSKEFRLDESPALFQFPVEFNIIDKKIKDFFSLPKNKREILSKKARDYAERFYSDNAWKAKYINSYLN